MAKRIGIISDTHGLLRPEVLEILKDCDYILHAGDIGSRAVLDQLWPLGALYAVRGNCDGEWARGIAVSHRFAVEGIRFFMAHEKRDVLRDPKDAQVLVFGHTHRYFAGAEDGRFCLNPGSCGERRFHPELTMAVMTAEDGRFRVEKIVLP